LEKAWERIAATFGNGVLTSRITELRKNCEGVGDPLYPTCDLITYLAVKTTWEASRGLRPFCVEDLRRGRVTKPVWYVTKMHCVTTLTAVGIANPCVVFSN